MKEYMKLQEKDGMAGGRFTKGYWFGVIVSLIAVGVMELIVGEYEPKHKVIGGVITLIALIAYYRWYK